MILQVLLSLAGTLIFFVLVAEFTAWTGRRAMLKALAAASCPYCEKTVGYAVAVHAVRTSEERAAQRGYVSENGFRVKCLGCRQEFLFRDGDRTVAPLREGTRRE